MDKDKLEQLFKDAMAWGRVYGEHLSPSTWDKMLDVMAKQFTDKALE